MTNIEFRELASEDMELVSELDREFPDRAGGGWLSAKDADEFAELAPKLAEAGLIAIVAVANGVPAGYGLVTPRNGPTGRDSASDSRILSHIAVLAAHRRAGIGKALLTELSDRARRNGATLIVARVPANERPFYESAGWTVAAPGDGLAWIEPASTRLWDRFKADGSPVTGGRRKMAMLRHVGADEDHEYPCMAYLVIAPQKLELLYTFPRNAATVQTRPYIKLAEMCVERNELFAELPADVSKTLEMFLERIVGPDGLARIKRLRR